MATGLRALASSSSSLLVPAQSISRVRSSPALAGIPKFRVGAAGMCTQRRAGLAGVVRAAVSEAPAARIGAVNTAGLPVKALMDALDAAGRRGAEVSTSRY